MQIAPEWDGAHSKSLARGLTGLKILVDEGAPMTATELGRRVGLHQSSISRVLATLTGLGYVRKDDQGRFVPDYGGLSLASSTSLFPLIEQPRQALQQVADAHAGINVSLCIWWRGQLIYLLRAIRDVDMLELGRPSFPMNISSPGLRVLIDLPEGEAVAALGESRATYGWGGAAEIVPPTELEVLAVAKKLVEHDVLILEGWHHAGSIGGAIPVKTPERHPVMLAISGAQGLADAATLRLWLHDARRTIEASLI